VEEKKKGCKVVIAILIIIIIALLAFIICTGNKLYDKGTSVTATGVRVDDEISFTEYEESEAYVLKITNTSDKPYINVTPTLIYVDANGVPFHEGWGARIGYMAPGESRTVRFYDTIKEYDTIIVGMIDREDGTVYSDLRDQITYSTELSEEVDEEGYQKLVFTGENKSDKEIDATFTVDYYDGDKLIYQDSFMEVVEPNGTIDTYTYYKTKYYDGTAFPEGFTYKVNLVEAVESVTEETEGEESVLFFELDPDYTEPEDKIESALFKVFKQTYGDDMASAKIVVDKMYTAKDAEKEEMLQSLNLGENDIAFEVSVDFEVEEGADYMPFTIPNGEFDEETRWVHGCSRLGVLRYDSETNKYCITDFGTGW